MLLVNELLLLRHRLSRLLVSYLSCRRTCFNGVNRISFHISLVVHRLMKLFASNSNNTGAPWKWSWRVEMLFVQL